MVLKSRVYKKPNRKSNKNRTAKKKMAIVRAPKSKQVHYHVRWAAVDRTIDLTAATTYENDAFHFQLNDLQNFSELTTLYDQYKITKVVMYLNWSPFAYSTGLNDTSKTPDLIAPLLMYVRDHDDGTAISLADFKQIGKTKQIRIRPGKQYKIAITPSILTEAYRSSATQAYMPKFNQKIDCNYPDVQHYGIKFGVQKPSISLGQINIRTKYYVSCYNSR